MTCSHCLRRNLRSWDLPSYRIEHGVLKARILHFFLGHCESIAQFESLIILGFLDFALGRRLLVVPNCLGQSSFSGLRDFRSRDRMSVFGISVGDGDFGRCLGSPLGLQTAYWDYSQSLREPYRCGVDYFLAILKYQFYLR